MARKDLLKGLMEQKSHSSPSLPRISGRAIGAVGQSIADLKARALIDVSAELIDFAGLDDRLDEDREGLEALKASIREYGQQVPVLLRNHPSAEGRYEVVFGRRRVMALKELGLPVKAMLRDLNDRELIVAQGQENSARKDLSFIEKANFAAQMIEAGFDRKVICDALSIDKTVISRMLAVTDAVPTKLIRAIGAAPSAGRDRWLALAKKIGDRPLRDLTSAAKGPDSDARFVAVFASLNAPRPAPATVKLESSDGKALGNARNTNKKTVIELSGEGRDFADWLLDHMAELHRDWREKNQ